MGLLDCEHDLEHNRIIYDPPQFRSVLQEGAVGRKGHVESKLGSDKVGSHIYIYMCIERIKVRVG